MPELAFETLIALLFHAVLAPATALHALLYKLDEVDGRPLHERLRDSLCWLFSPYL